MAVSLRAGVALVLLGCSSLPRPPTGPVPPGAPGREVPYPPPPARVETLPPQPAASDVWIDGQWDWDGEAWKWLPGAWVTPPANAYFTPWTATLLGNGRYLFVRATWRGRDGRPVGPGFRVPQQVCPGGSRAEPPS